MSSKKIFEYKGKKLITPDFREVKPLYPTAVLASEVPEGKRVQVFFKDLDSGQIRISAQTFRVFGHYEIAAEHQDGPDIIKVGDKVIALEMIGQTNSKGEAIADATSTVPQRFAGDHVVTLHPRDYPVIIENYQG